ncbi:MAG: AbrB/MazE/SpoVT family DNA-binding domain-containing protein [Sphingomonadales bacterium]|nr:AbrB/MazE/SpoVT family DNA-binding domain-containing protein [Sphingomonadales bacterium]
MNAPQNLTRKSRIFKSNRSQAVRIPKDLAFPDTIKDVIIRRSGNDLIISPKDTFWEDFFAQPGIDIIEPEDNLPLEQRESF